MIRMLCGCIVAFLCLAAQGADVSGKDDAVILVPDQKGYRIKSKGDDIYSIERRISLRPKEQVKVFVDDTNPLLFEYEGEKLTPINTANFDAVLKFGEVLKKFVPPKSPATGPKIESTSDTEGRLSFAGVDVKEVEESLQTLSSYITNVTLIIDQTLTKDTANDAKNAVKEWKDLLAIKATLVDIEAKMAFVAGKTSTDLIPIKYTIANNSMEGMVPVGCVVFGYVDLATVEGIVDYIARNEAARAAFEEDAIAESTARAALLALSDVKDLEKADLSAINDILKGKPGKISDSDLEALVGKIDATKTKYQSKADAAKRLAELASALEQLKEARDILANSPPVGGFEVKNPSLSCGEAVEKAIGKDPAFGGRTWTNSVRSFNVLFANRGEIGKLIAACDSLIEFRKLALDVSSKKELLSVIYDARHVQPVKVIVSPNPSYVTFFSENARKAQAKGSFEGKLEFEPKEFFHLKVSPSIVYSFVDVSEFSAVKNDTGKLIVTETESDYAALNVAAMMNICSEKYYGSGIVPFIQIGLTPNPDEWAFFLGGGLEFYEGMTIAAGAVYQQVEELKGGISVGMEVPDQAAIKTKDEFKTGLYVQLGYNF